MVSPFGGSFLGHDTCQVKVQCDKQGETVFATATPEATPTRVAVRAVRPPETRWTDVLQQAAATN